MRKIIVVPLALLMLLALAVTAQAQETPSVQTADDPTFGTILTDSNGMSLYLFTEDERDKSNCSGGCAVAWPTLLTTGDPVAGDGVHQGSLDTISRDDESTRITYNGWPFYYFANDNNPGNTAGQYGTWFVVSVSGGPITTSAVVSTSEHPELGTILIEASGRTLYLFTPDVPDQSNCAGGCARTWQPIATVEAPTADGSAIAALLGTITRADRYTQVTYDSQPFYYFARDVAPGDATGQNVNEVWFVLSPSSQAILPELPATGDGAVPTLALLTLLASMVLIGTGGGVLAFRTRRRPVPLTTAADRD